MTAAHHYLGQLDKEVGDALAGNVGTSVIFRANGPLVAEHVGATGGAVRAATIANLPMFHAIVTRNAADDVSSAPFTMTVDPSLRPQTCTRASLAEVMAASRRPLQDLDLSRLDPADFVPSKAESAPEADSKPAGFLDDWLTRRQEAARQQLAETEDRAEAADQAAGHAADQDGFEHEET